MTKAQLISDVMLRISGGKPSDDVELEESQVAFWIDQILGSLIKEVLDAKLKKGESIDASFLEHEDQLTPILDSKSWMDVQNSVYLPLCKVPISLYRGGEIVYLETQDGKSVDRSTRQKLGFLKSLTFSKPSLENLIYHREGDRIYINGLDENNLDFAVFNIWYVARPDLLTSLANEDEVKMSEEMPALLAEAVTNLAKAQVAGPSDYENDGQQDLS